MTLAVIFSFTCIVYAYILSQVKKVDVRASFFYLVTDDVHVEAGAEFVKLEGGAGYLLRYDDKDYVVLSVYLRESDGLTIQTSLSRNGENTKLLHVGVDVLYFKTYSEKKMCGVYVGALQILRSCMTVLNECISRLEKGMTQESCKRVLTPLGNQFHFLSEEYRNSYPSFAKVCRETVEELSALVSQTVYVKDLRYLLCVLSENYVTLASAFAL